MLLALWTWRTGEWAPVGGDYSNYRPPKVQIPIVDSRKTLQEDETLLLLLL